MTSPSPSALLKLQGAGVAYPQGVALQPVTIELRAGEVMGLCGENGAGKSTFLKVALGLVAPTSGQVERQPGQRIGMVHQHYSLVPELTVAENVWLGNEPIKHGLYDSVAAREQTARLAHKLGVQIDPDARTDTLSVSEQQRIEWLKAMRDEPAILLLDEPTATLSPHEIEGALGLIKKLSAQGTAVVFVTHKLKETFAVANRIAVLSRGKLVLDDRVSNLTEEKVAIAMVGAAKTATRPTAATLGEEILSAQALRYGALKRASFSVHAREILGIAGVEGNGQSELFAALAGVVQATGTLTLKGHSLLGQSPGARRERGLRIIPADRHHEGLLMDTSAAQNLRLGQPNDQLDQLVQVHGRALLDEFGVQPSVPTLIARSFSGGNQQKLLFAREMAHTLTQTPAPTVYIVREPTRGVDFAAQQHLWKHLQQAAEAGACVVVMSSDLDEIRSLCHRVCVLYRGETSEVVDITQADEAEITAWLGKQLGGLGDAARGAP